MCGLAGFAGLGQRVDLQGMAGALVHRGPDGDGFFVDALNQVFLAHRRLAVIDVEGGRQPMWNEDDQVGVVFNGEIYNHAELRSLLEQRGHRFRSDHSDTEVLVHGYEEWGEDLPARLNGMFAFAVYDRRRKLIFLARDRFGEKPLFYAHHGDLFAFASELRALAAHPQIGSRLNLKALQKLFAYGYIPAPNSVYEGCWKLPAGHHLTFDLTTKSSVVRSYWRFRVEPDENLGKRSEDSLIEELRHHLFRAVDRRLVSDVPLGIFLSGGVDSSTILAIASKLRPPSSLKTFTIGFTEPSFDESAVARDTARFFGTDHQERQLDLCEARRLIPDVLGRLDEPLGDASILPTYLLCRFAREQVTVALSGDGGDELFAGYDPFRALKLASVYAAVVPRTLHKGMRRLADFLPVSQSNMSFDFRIRRALMGLSYPSSVWNPVWMAPVEPSLMAEIFETPVALEDLYSEAIALWNDGESKGLTDRTLDFFTNLYLQDNILTKVDRAGMMVSLESRAIFLDNDLVEFARRLPNRYKFRNGQQKYLLKRAMSPDLPLHVLSRPKKGFGLPLAKWLTAMDPPPAIEQSGMKTHVFERWWQEHRRGRVDHRLSLWTYLSMNHFLSSSLYRPGMQKGAA